MSHTQTVKVAISNKEAFKEAAKEVNAKSFSTEERDVRLYDSVQRGMFVHFTNWQYPVVVTNGELRYDNFEGRWGNESDLNAFRQSYATNVIRIAGVSDGKPLVSDTREGNSRILLLQNQDGSQTRAVINETGDTLLEVVGCAGSVCRNHTSHISNALGVATGEELKPEFREMEMVRELERE